MRLSTATIKANTELQAGVHLIEMHVPQLAQAIQPGQYCMVRCCDSSATDPLLRRPFFIQSVNRNRGLCVLIVKAAGRGTNWLVQQPEGATLDILGPLGHGWLIRPTVRNLLLVSEGINIVALTLLAQTAIEQELAVTLVSQFSSAGDAYPPALLPPEVEYHIVTGNSSLVQPGDASTALSMYLNWADAAFCSVSHETSAALYSRFERLRTKNFAQGTLLTPLVCGAGVCLTCAIKTYSGTSLICREGPVFDLREIAR